MALNTLNTRVTRHFASFFRRTTYVYANWEIADMSPLEGKSTENSHKFPNDGSLTSRLAKARLIGVSSLHSTTHHYPTYTHTHTRARAHDTQRTHTHALLSFSLFPTLAPIFSLQIFLLISFLLFHSSFSLPLFIFYLFSLSFVVFFSIESVLLF